MCIFDKIAYVLQKISTNSIRSNLEISTIISLSSQLSLEKEALVKEIFESLLNSVTLIVSWLFKTICYFPYVVKLFFMVKNRINLLEFEKLWFNFFLYNYKITIEFSLIVKIMKVWQYLYYYFTNIMFLVLLLKKQLMICF